MPRLDNTKNRSQDMDRMTEQQVNGDTRTDAQRKRDAQDGMSPPHSTYRRDGSRPTPSFTTQPARPKPRPRRSRPTLLDVGDRVKLIRDVCAANRGERGEVVVADADAVYPYVVLFDDGETGLFREGELKVSDTDFDAALGEGRR